MKVDGSKRGFVLLHVQSETLHVSGAVCHLYAEGIAALVHGAVKVLLYDEPDLVVGEMSFQAQPGKDFVVAILCNRWHVEREGVANAPTLLGQRIIGVYERAFPA